MSFTIQVIKPVTEIVLELSMHPTCKDMLVIEDLKGRETLLNLAHCRTFAPSTALSRWCNYYLKDELCKLKGKGSTITYRDYVTPQEEEDWKFRTNPQYFGLNEFYRKGSHKLIKASIDDSIGMRNVVAILVGIGYNVDIEYDSDKKLVKKIILSKEKTYEK